MHNGIGSIGSKPWIGDWCPGRRYRIKFSRPFVELFEFHIFPYYDSCVKSLSWIKVEVLTMDLSSSRIISFNLLFYFFEIEIERFNKVSCVLHAGYARELLAITQDVHENHLEYP